MIYWVISEYYPQKIPIRPQISAPLKYAPEPHPKFKLSIYQECLFPGVKFFFSCQTSAHSQQLQGYLQWEDVWLTYFNSNPCSVNIFSTPFCLNMALSRVRFFWQIKFHQSPQFLLRFHWCTYGPILALVWQVLIKFYCQCLISSMTAVNKLCWTYHFQNVTRTT